MNERIKELALQAGHEIISTGQYNFEEFLKFQEKFAELIVKECLSITMLTHSEGNEDNYSYDEALEHVHFNMKQHFGVEE